MKGLMQHWPLTTDRFLEHAARWHGAREIVSRLDGGALARRSYASLMHDAKALSSALVAAHVRPGDRVATLAMNGAAHLQAWYAITGIGAICHTLNPRMAPEQLEYIVRDAGDGLVFADGAFAALLSSIMPGCPSIERVVWLSAPTVPPQQPVPALLLEDFIALGAGSCHWGDFSEESACGLCYTSGTTGPPRGVLYSHRSNFLHTLTILQPDVFALSECECILPVVPMYHANAWGIVYAAPAVGAKLVLPGNGLDSASLLALIEREAVTLALGVPSVWLPMLQRMRSDGRKAGTLKRVIVGGAACPEVLIRDFASLGIEAIHAWGMTEMAPVGGAATMTDGIGALPFERQLPWRIRQGRSPCTVELMLKDDQGELLPHDGVATGHLLVRGPAIVERYFGDAVTRLDADGYFDTGDIASIDPQGFMHIADRAKDIIKSGGEWISSQYIESIALTHPQVASASVIGIPHSQWGERPLLLAVARPGACLDGSDLLQFLSTHLPKWQLPDAAVIVQELPLGPTGKVDKKKLRALHAAGQLGH